ncbi:MAG: RimK family alpha-L-glutamate ligase [Desulfobacterales bacterium]
MNIGVITVRRPSYHPNRRLMEAAAAKGHSITLVHPYRVWGSLKGGNPALLGHPSMENIDAVLPRQGATLGEASLLLIHHFSMIGIPLVNNLNSIRVAKNQFLTLQTLAAAGVPVPDTALVNSVKGIKNALAWLGGFPVVIKRASSRQGEGVTLVEKNIDVERAARHHLNQSNGILVQRFFPTRGRRDIRVLIVGGKIVGSMELKPKQGDFRANYHLSGKSIEKKLSPTERDIALSAAAAVGLEIAGIDLIVDKNNEITVIEVNYSPGFRGLEKATGLDIAGHIVDHVLYKINQPEKNRAHIKF